MGRLLLRRSAFILLVCTLIVFFCHLGLQMASNSSRQDPSFDMSSEIPRAWADARRYIMDALRGQFGFIQTDYGPVLIKQILREAYVNSMGLLLVTLAFSAALGLTLGTILALTRYRQLVLPILSFTLFGISTPSFFAALLLQQGEIWYLRTFGRRLVSMAGFGWDLEHMLLPLLVLSARPIAYLARATFQALTNIMEKDYIRTAYAKGLGRQRVVNIHAFRNLAVPVLTAVGVSLRFSLGSLPVVELFFNWPGLGHQLIQAIDARQTALVTSLALELGLTFLFANLVLDLLYRLIDPRLRSS